MQCVLGHPQRILSTAVGPEGTHSGCGWYPHLVWSAHAAGFRKQRVLGYSLSCGSLQLFLQLHTAGLEQA